MADNDPGNLDRLHDIIDPPSSSWWPPAPAWYAVAVIVLVLVGLLACQVLLWRARNRYRRLAIKELANIDTTSPRALAELAELVKRTALAAFPRDRVASLTGDEWFRFLDTSGSTSDFTQGAGRALGDAEYSAISPPVTPDLIARVRHWIQHHRTDRPC